MEPKAVLLNRAVADTDKTRGSVQHPGLGISQSSPPVIRPCPRGFNTTINSGNRVRFAIRAATIARPVSSPKYILGMKLENANMENPRVMVTEV